MAGQGWINALHPDDRATRRRPCGPRRSRAAAPTPDAGAPLRPQERRRAFGRGARRSRSRGPAARRGFLGILEDVTDACAARKNGRTCWRAPRRRAPRRRPRARRPRRRARTSPNILSRISDAFIALDQDGRYTYVNERALAIVRPAARRADRQSVVGAAPAARSAAPFTAPSCRRSASSARVTVETMYGSAALRGAPVPVADGRVVLLRRHLRSQAARRAADQRSRVPAAGARRRRTSRRRSSAAQPGLRTMMERVAMVAATNTNVLITGETGTGKELVARAIHEASPRRERLLVTVNCAAISAGLVESELFGHEKGAFTGAVAAAQGPLRAGARRDAVPRRDRRAAAGDAGQAAARAAGARVRARRRQRDDPRRRARHRGDQPQPARAWSRAERSARTCSTGSTSSR